MELEYGKYPICGKEKPLDRTYFYYNIPCECCGCNVDGKNMHFELRVHCDECVPDIPRSIKYMLISKIDNKQYCIEIKGILPYKIRGAFRIEHDCTENHIK